MAGHAAIANYEVILPTFEGPLDLLLHLVKRHELDILDIPIAFITEKYLEYLDLMRALSLDVAGEYLLMAATLAHLKSKELLPASPLAEEPEEDEDGPDPREALILRLLEYQKYKEAASSFASFPTLGKTIFPRGVPIEPIAPNEIPFAEVGMFSLLSAFSDILKRSRVKLTHDVVIDRISITDRIHQIVDLFETQETIRFLDCFTLEGTAPQLRHDIIVTFLAILEMGRLRMIRLFQQDVSGDIFLTVLNRDH